MFNMIAHAVGSEFEEGIRGRNGSQNGYELCCVQWYSYPWSYIIRPQNKEDAEAIAEFMEKSAANGNIGYSNTIERNSYFNLLLENEFDPENITTLCACDCSSLVYCATYNVTRKVFVSNDDHTGQCPLVRHFEYYLTETCGGFDILTDEKYVTSSDHLERGDILVALGHHIAVWI